MSIEEQPAPVPDTIYNDPKADVEFVTSDNVLFRVHSHFLRVASAFFDHMLFDDSRLTSSVIPLSEKANIIRILMHFICQSDDDLAETMKDLRTKATTWTCAISLFNAAEKYQLQRRVTEFRGLFKTLAQANPLESFVWNCRLPEPMPHIWTASLSRFPRIRKNTYAGATWDPDPSDPCLEFIEAIGPKYWHCYWGAYNAESMSYIQDQIAAAVDAPDEIDELTGITDITPSVLLWSTLARYFLAHAEDYDEKMSAKVVRDRGKLDLQRNKSLKRPASSIDE